MGAVSNETLEQYAKGVVPPTASVVETEAKVATTVVDTLAEDAKKFVDSPEEAIKFLNEAKNYIQTGFNDNAVSLIDRVINTMQAAFSEHSTHCERTN